MGKKSIKKKKKQKTKKREKIESITATNTQPINQEDLNKLIDSSSVDKQYERILGILDVQSEEEAIVNEENLEKYLMYLREKIEMPCIVTGIEDLGCFGWEEYYNFGPGNRREYEKLKIKYPSFRDEYLLLEFDDDLDKEEGLHAHVQRISDKKKFILTLADLKAVDKKTNNARLLDDHAVWDTNFRY